MIMIYWLKKRNVPWREFILFIIIIAPWITFSYFYFDSVFPSSLQAKKGYVSFIHYLVNALRSLAQYCDRYNFFLFSFLSQKVTYFLSPSDSYSKYVSVGSLVILYIPIIMLGIIYYKEVLKCIVTRE